MRLYGERSSRENRTTTWTSKSSHYISVVFSRYPILVLITTILLSFLTSWLGISNYGLPEFEDPYLGFETRKTSIANKLFALDNLRTEVKQLNILENFPGERVSNREWRKRREINSLQRNNYCSVIPVDENSRIALEISPNSTLFSLDVLQRICYYEKLLENLDSYPLLCEKDGGGHCCPMWSLPNYIALHENIGDCTDMTEQHVKDFHEKITICANIYANETEATKCLQSTHNKNNNSQLCPWFCTRENVFEAAIIFTMDKSYFSSNITRFSMMVLPIPKNHPLWPVLEDLQNSVMNIHLPDNVIFLGGFDFGTKDVLFKELLISDLEYVIMASVLIFIIVCSYTKSFLVTAMSFAALTLSLGISYFLYNAVFRIPYFPFMNMLVTIIVLGIGTDGTLILSVAWRRCRSNLKDEPFDKNLKLSVMEETLKETTSTLFITTCTTAGAFFASLTSSITTIRCFSVFAGTTILVSFILLYLCVPTALLVSDIIWAYICALITHPEDNTLISKLLLFGKKFQSVRQFFKNAIFRVKLNKILKIITATKWAILTFSVFVGILIWGLFEIFYYPGFMLPNTEQFQLLSYNHPIERYDREVESHFSTEESSEHDKLTIYFIWGIKNVDNGASFNPNDDGFLEFDNKFTVSGQESQNWTRNFCTMLKKLPFYDHEANIMLGANYDSCFIEGMMSWMDRDCEKTFLLNSPSHKPCCKMSTFPYESAVFSKCTGNYVRDVYRTPARFFTPDVAGPKFFTTYMNINNNAINNTGDLMQGDKKKKKHDNIRRRPAPERMGELATITIRIRTTFNYTLSYEKMSKFYNELEEFFNEALQQAPESLRQGFFVSSQFDFLDLQHSLLNDTWQSLLLSTGICFAFIWISSGSFLISLGAVLTILATVVVSSALLIEVFSWKLGVFESIAVTVAVGLSDFTAHHAIEFAKRKSIIEMTSPTFFSALTTIIMGLSMMIFSQVLVYQQIGRFFFVLVLISWLYSVFFLSPLLLLFHSVSSRLMKYVNSVVHDWRNKSDNNHATNRPLRATKICECSTKENCDCDIASENLVENELNGEEKKNECEPVSAKDPSLMIEKMKLLKKIAQETTV